MKYIPILIEEFEEIKEGKPVAMLVRQQAKKGEVMGFLMVDDIGMPTWSKLHATALKAYAMGANTWAVTLKFDCEV